MLNPRAAFVGQAWVKLWVKWFEGLLAGEETGQQQVASAYPPRS
jgi:hypothetical protein